MKFGEIIKNARENQQIPQKTIAAALNIDTPMYSRIERGERPARREQVITIAKHLHINPEELIRVWMADRVFQLIKEEDDISGILNSVAEEVDKNKENREDE